MRVKMSKIVQANGMPVCVDSRPRGVKMRVSRRYVFVAIGALLFALMLALTWRNSAAAKAPNAETPRGTVTLTNLSATERAELLKERESVWRAWFSNDQKTLKEVLPPELVAINNGEAEWENLDKTLSGAQEFAKKGGKLVELNFARTEVQLYGDVAILYSQYSTTTSVSGMQEQATGRATEVFVKRRGHWVNTGWHLDSGK
jgi:hypothetical protein